MWTPACSTSRTTLSSQPNFDVAARELLQYLLAHPAAADTAAGIQVWWLRGRHSMTTVDAVISKLNQQGLLQAHDFTPGKPLYGLREDSRAQAQAWIDACQERM